MHGDTFPDDWYWDVNFHWARPVDISYDFDALDTAADDEYGLYRFERGHALREGPREIIRIGLAFDQPLGKRIRQYRSSLEDYRRRGSLCVSWAGLVLDGQHRRERYEGAEHLLIWAVQPERNDRKRAGVPNDFYRIENTGYRGLLPRQIIFPLLRAQ